jgi:hypothetical protein
MKRKTTGTRGSSASAKNQGHTVDSGTEREPIVEGEGAGPASVGISVSVSVSSEYARQKVEASAWCTLPCGDSEEDRETRFNEAAMNAMDQVERRLTEAVERFFPEVEW